jgi:hypothetical protein
MPNIILNPLFELSVVVAFVINLSAQYKLLADLHLFENICLLLSAARLDEELSYAWGTPKR